jgi:hypothetical protein
MRSRKLLYVGLGFAAITSCAWACCVVSGGTWVQLANEKVIIVWDEEHKTQHFIRQARFDTKADDFGFIVPTPAEPKLAVANPDAYLKLERLVPRPLGAAKKSSGAVMMGAGGVDVIRTERVGDYQATIVRATDGKAMNDWLKANGYVSRPAMEEWLDYYAKQQWVFTAFKFLRKEPTGAWTQAIRVSFPTDKPRYPYKMPKDTWPAGWRRPLNIYFVAPHRIESKYVGSDRHWEAKEKWSGNLPQEMRAGLAADLSLKDSDLPANAVVTIFENGENPYGYAEDLYFTASTAAAPWAWLGGGVALVTLMALLRRRKSGVADGPEPLRA